MIFVLTENLERMSLSDVDRGQGGLTRAASTSEQASVYPSDSAHREGDDQIKFARCKHLANLWHETQRGLDVCDLLEDAQLVGFNQEDTAKDFLRIEFR